jgi:hypothetical protein
MCAACHGSTHAESPSSNAPDNLQAMNRQGSSGPLGNCTTCHKTGISSTNGGPHGMHAVGSAWVSAHQNAAGRNAQSCIPCHGTDLRGTALSQAFAPLTLSVSRAGTIQMFRGYQVSCYTCHNGPGGSGTAPPAPSVSDATASATAGGQSVDIPITVTNNAVLRIVSQPSGGTAFVTGNRITYMPGSTFQGTDKVTYAAIASGKDSNLGTATIQVSAPAPQSVAVR